MKKKTKERTIVSALIIPGAAVATSFIMRKVFELAYRKIKKKDPPKSLLSTKNYTKGHIIGWTIATSALTGLVSFLTLDIMRGKFGRKNILPTE